MCLILDLDLNPLFFLESYVFFPMDVLGLVAVFLVSPSLYGFFPI